MAWACSDEIVACWHHSRNDCLQPFVAPQFSLIIDYHRGIHGACVGSIKAGYAHNPLVAGFAVFIEFHLLSLELYELSSDHVVSINFLVNGRYACRLTYLVVEGYHRVAEQVFVASSSGASIIIEIRLIGPHLKFIGSSLLKDGVTVIIGC